MIDDRVIKKLQKKFQKALLPGPYEQIESVTRQVSSLNNFCLRFLERLIKHSFANNIFYERVFKDSGFAKGKKIYPGQFEKLPILTKEIIRSHASEIISRDYTTRKWFYNSSDGSSGEPIKLLQDHVFERWRQATGQYYHNNILNVDWEESRKVILWGCEQDIFEQKEEKFFIEEFHKKKNVFLNCFKMNEEDMKRFIEIINVYHPEIIRGYASALYRLCQYVQIQQYPIFKPRVVISSAEVLNDDMRCLVESVFGQKAFNLYGAREVNYIAGECSQGLWHIFIFNNMVEVLDQNDRGVGEGEEGRIVITNLHNFSMPLIRYELGDMAVLGPVHCRCGNPLPTLKAVTGRMTDHFLKSDKSWVHGGFFIQLLRDKGWIKQFQVIQEDYLKISILASLKTAIIEAEQKEIEDKIKSAMGSECHVDWKFVDAIPETKTGKNIYTRTLMKV